MLTICKNIQSEEIIPLTLVNMNHRNTKFLKQAHNLWFRFKNYEKHPAFALKESDKIVAVIFATTSERTKYINLYEIVTIAGEERKGYATKIWSEFIAYWYDKGMKRIKLSCTPSSVTWHLKNGLVFWSVDKQGSLRSDQPLMRTIEDQKDLRWKAIRQPELVLPDYNTRQKLLLEDLETLHLSQRRLTKVFDAIEKVRGYWFRRYLYGL